MGGHEHVYVPASLSAGHSSSNRLGVHFRHSFFLLAFHPASHSKTSGMAYCVLRMPRLCRPVPCIGRSILRYIPSIVSIPALGTGSRSAPLS